MKNIILLLLCVLLIGCNAKENRKADLNNTPATPIQNPEVNMVVDDGEVQTLHTDFQVNVYLENSGSMNGYVNEGKTEFQQNIFNYLDDVEQWYRSSLNLFYINSQVVNKGNDLDGYVNKLTPKDFRVSGGSTATTDIAELFETVLKRTNDSMISILISDCIFSPGTNNDPAAFLGNQQVKIKRAFENYLSDATHHDLAVMVYQFYSDFKGIYYDYLNKPHKNYSGKRPYYIWAIGHPQKLTSLQLSLLKNGFLHPVNNYWCITSMPLTAEKYSILPYPKKGSFEKENNNTVMKKMKKDSNGEFMFTVGVDFGLFEPLLGEDYLLETNHYSRIINKQVSDDWYITVTPNTVTASPATHNIMLSTQNSLPQGDFDLAICRKKPQWADDYTDMDDRSLSDSNQLKTYGLHYIFDGIVLAFTAKNGDYYSIMNFKMR